MLSLATAVILASGTVGASPQNVDQVVEREFRLYRIQVYNTYRTRRSEYDRRCAAGSEAYDAWKTAGGAPQQAHDLIVWFRGAKMASLAHVNRPLPALPNFPALPPRAIAATPTVAQPPKPTSPAAQRQRQFVERFEVRELQAGEKPRLAVASSPTHAGRKPQPSWKSVSSALYKGVVFGASRAVPK